jgi:hypothetical protein
MLDHVDGNFNGDNMSDNIIVDHQFGDTDGMSISTVDFSTVKVMNVEGIDWTDAPKFCDAYISEAEIDGVEATDEQLEEINNNGEFLLDAVYDYIY